MEDGDLNLSETINEIEDGGSNEGTHDTPDVDALLRSRKHKVKIDDTEEEVDYDDLVKNYQKGKSADKRFQEAAMTRKQAERAVKEYEDFLHSAAQNPEMFFKHTGKDAREWAEELLLRKIEWESLSPAEQKAKMYDEQEERRRLEQEEHKKREENEKRRAYEEQAITEIDNEISEVLEKSGRKPTARTIYRIAEYVLNSIDETTGKPKLAPAKALERVQKDYADDLRDHIGGMSAEELIAFLGPENVSKVHSHKINSLSPKVPSFPSGNRPQGKPSAPKKKTIDDWLKD